MPPVAQLTVACLAGFLAGRLAPGPWWLPAFLVLPSLVLWRRAPWAAVLALAAGVGGAHGRLVAGREVAGCGAAWAPGRHAAVVRMADTPGPNGLADAIVRHAPEGCAGRIRLRLRADGVPSGATLVVVGDHQPGAALRVGRYRVLRRAPPLRFRIRDAVGRRIAGLYGARAPIVDALVLGRRGGIPPELRADFVAAGLAHLLAISGLHVGIIAAWLAVLGRALRLGHRAIWLSAAGAWAYVFLLGFPAPATRAATFVGIGALARARQRHPRGGAVLAVAVLVVLAVDPAAATQAGAWLSVAAVWGTAEANGVIRRLRRPRPAVRLLAVSVGAVLATAPITAHVFGQVSLAGVVTNLAAVPLAGVVVPGVLASLASGALPAAGAGLALAALERIAAVGARLPLGVIDGDPGPRFAVPWLVVLGAALWLVRRRPTWPVAARRGAVILAAVVWAGLARDVWTRDRYDGLSLYLLDVGQGDAIALRSPHGRWMLVDAGPRMGGRDAGRTVVAPFLRRQGVRSLDLLVVTHGDADHVGGAPSVLAAVPAAAVVEPGQPLGSGPYRAFLSAVDEAGGAWRAARAGDVIDWDGVRIAVLHPSDRWMRGEVRPNENSVVLHVTYGAFDALLTGDAGLPVEAVVAPAVTRVEVLKIGHHGSAGSTGAALLAAAAPRVALLSVGPNGYGHPAPAVTARLAERGIATYRTDRGGMVTVRSDGMYFEVLQSSSPHLASEVPVPRSRLVTIESFIIEQERMYPEATGELTNLLYDVALAAKVISSYVRRAGLAAVLGRAGATNVQGEEQQKLDVLANEVMKHVIQKTGRVCVTASEEDAEPVPVTVEHHPGKYVLLFDPLDGSSNIDVNASIGTIFSIHRRITPDDTPGTLKDCLQTGRDQVAAGYVIYGSSTILVYTSGHGGVHGFTLDPRIGEFLLSHATIKTPETGTYYSVNESNYDRWTPGYREVVRVFKSKKNARYIGSLVADFHRNLIAGGIFLYPSDTKSPKGKLRLLYEAAPLAFIAKAAGGMATDGERPILDIEPTELHQRTPLVIGSAADVAFVRETLARTHAGVA